MGLLLAGVLGVGFALLLGVRLKQAFERKAAVAEQRVATQAVAARRAPIKTAKPSQAMWLPRVDVTGSLKPWRDADLGFEMPGKLVRVAVAVGDRVTEGQPLAVLDASRAAAQVGQAESGVRAAEANLALAEDNLKRTDALVTARSVPDAVAEQARQQVALARAQLEGARAAVSLAKSGAGLTAVVAPFAGVVTRAPTGIGSVVNPGVPLIHVEDTSRFRLSVTVGEEDVPLIALGAPVDVVYRDRTVSGSVLAIVPSLDQATRRAPVEIEVPNDGRLLAWGFVRARIHGKGKGPALRLPAEARRPGAQDEVVLAVGGKAKVAKVSFAVDDDGSLVVQRGLKPDDEVCLSPSPDLKDGDVLSP
jgi:membrane fusion protein (multidrug efflux system)